ncbi:protein kinase domain-containing protein [Citrus sinensis]|uniref:Protein kinase domain-containing protein n=1 Tax=Citrus sinensis TaxID=2711 RepID=A0ACB8JEJ3_CITSI|nr:protein kinase domain-containing protein [Citrus sinensis]
MNSFYGFIPNTFGNLRNLNRLGLNDNYLTSSTPKLNFLSSLSNCKYLKYFSFSNNSLDGILPRAIGNLSQSMEIFWMHSCNISGGIPEEISNLTNLIAIYLGGNKLNGSIPIALGKLQKLQLLNLEYNQLEGSIPDDLCRLAALFQLDLGSNKLSGFVPASFGNLTNLRSLHLGSNQITSIPSTLLNLKDILYLNLSSNFFTGPLPLEIGNLKVLIKIDLSMNNFSGVIPITIGYLKDLQYLFLEYNRLQGSIPDSIGDLINLKSLDLSNNNLSGIIPISLEKLLDLKDINVSFNKLEGEIPREGSFRNFLAESFKGNELLCDDNMVAHLSDFGMAKPLLKEDQSLIQTQTLATIGYMAPAAVPRFRLPFIPFFSGSGSPSCDFNCYIVGNRGISRLPRRFWEMRNYRDSVKSCFRSLGDRYRLEGSFSVFCSYRSAERSQCQFIPGITFNFFSGCCWLGSVLPLLYPYTRVCFVFFWDFNMSNRKGKLITDESDEETGDSDLNLSIPTDVLRPSGSVGPSHGRDTLEYPRPLTISPSPELELVGNKGGPASGSGENHSSGGVGVPGEVGDGEGSSSEPSGPAKKRNLGHRVEADSYPIDFIACATTPTDLFKLRNLYNIPNEVLIVVPGKGDVPGRPPKWYVTMHLESFRLGARLPLQRYFAKIRGGMHLAPGQLHPNGWRVLSAMFVLWERCGLEEPSLVEVKHLYQLRSSPRAAGWYYFMSSSAKRKPITGFPSSCMDINEILVKLHKRFPSLPQNALLTIYKARSERMRLLMRNNIPADIRWLIEAKVRLAATPNRQFKNICVLSGFTYGKHKEFVDAAIDLGRSIAERKLHLVYGGGNRGLSKLISEATFVRGSQVLGIIPRALKLLGSLSDSSTGEELVVSGMQERITEMLNHADAFIFLPGDLAILEALITLASWAHLHIHRKPIGLLNINNFYDGFIAFLNHAIKNYFVHSNVKKLFICVHIANELLDMLQAYRLEPDPWTIVLERPNNDDNSSRSKKYKLDLTLRL